LWDTIDNRENLKEFCEQMLKMRTSQILDALYKIEDDEKFNKAFAVLKDFEDKELVAYRKITEEIRYLVKANVLFADPVERILKPQSRLDLHAIRRVIEWQEKQPQT